MAKDPAVLFYTSDFLSGTSFLSYEEKGQYITLLCQQHQLYEIPENHMINICKSYDSPVIKKFVKTDTGYYNKRMREEAEKRRSYCDSRSNNKSGRPNKKIIWKSYGNHMENDNRDENVNKNGNKNKKSKQKTYDFESVWIKYPKKIGKSVALGTFNITVKNDEDFKDINRAVDNYNKHIKNSTIESKYIKTGGNWFEDWKDWIDYQELEVKTELQIKKENEDRRKKELDKYLEDMQNES